MNKKHTLFSMSIIFISLLFSSCLTSYKAAPDGENNSMVYGYLSAEVVKGLSSGHSVLIQLLPMEYDIVNEETFEKSEIRIEPSISQIECYSMMGFIKAGKWVFYINNLNPGEYYLAYVIVNYTTSKNVNTTFCGYFTKPDKGNGIIVKKNKATYAGAYIFQNDRSISVSRDVNKSDVIEGVLKELKGRGWEKYLNE